MKRLCVFAHWDKDCIVDEYVIYYLKTLKKVCSTLIFVSDCENIKNRQSLTGIADYTLIQNHGEYDFGSYKRGFLFAKEHGLDFDELVLANDSCYGPFYPLEPVFDKMSKKKCDFWGLTKNNYGINNAAFEPHLQSYFLIFKPQVFKSKAFEDFINSIKQEQDKGLIISKYEIGLSKTLHEHGVKSEVYIDKYNHTANTLTYKWKRLITRHKFPFVKTSVIKNGIYVLGEVKDWREVISSVSDYPLNLIENHAGRFKITEENKFSKLNLYRKIRFRVLNNSPMEVRNAIIWLEKNLYSFLNKLCFNKLQKF